MACRALALGSANFSAWSEAFSALTTVLIKVMLDGDILHGSIHYASGWWIHQDHARYKTMADMVWVAQTLLHFYHVQPQLLRKRIISLFF
jgi:hypothetical protein